MKNIPYDAYDVVLDALLDKGYSESEAEVIICQIIEDQKEFDDIAKRIHNIITQNKLFH